MYKCTFARNPRCSRRRRIDEADISRPVAVDQRAANCLEEAVRLFTTMQSRCHLPSFIASFLSYSVLVGSLLPNSHLWNCSTAHEVLLRDKEIFLLEGR
ncbi:uncharacterized protein TNCV_1396651 [Trichonephila clavipes]|nr:uncharacterized protein TNCV_1396651 [Trichonephila clavipes]